MLLGRLCTFTFLQPRHYINKKQNIFLLPKKKKEIIFNSTNILAKYFYSCQFMQIIKFVNEVGDYMVLTRTTAIAISFFLIYSRLHLFYTYTGLQRLKHNDLHIINISNFELKGSCLYQRGEFSYNY